MGKEKERKKVVKGKGGKSKGSERIGDNYVRMGRLKISGNHGGNISHPSYRSRQ